MMPLFLTTEEVIAIIETHKEHWERLLREKICDETEGRETIAAFDRAISALKEENKGECKECKWFDNERIYNPECENCSRNFNDNFCTNCGRKKESE